MTELINMDNIQTSHFPQRAHSLIKQSDLTGALLKFQAEGEIISSRRLNIKHKVAKPRPEGEKASQNQNTSKGRGRKLGNTHLTWHMILSARG